MLQRRALALLLAYTTYRLLCLRHVLGTSLSSSSAFLPGSLPTPAAHEHLHGHACAQTSGAHERLLTAFRFTCVPPTLTWHHMHRSATQREPGGIWQPPRGSEPGCWRARACARCCIWPRPTRTAPRKHARSPGKLSSAWQMTPRSVQADRQAWMYVNWCHTCCCWTLPPEGSLFWEVFLDSL